MESGPLTFRKLTAEVLDVLLQKWPSVISNNLIITATFCSHNLKSS